MFRSNRHLFSGRQPINQRWHRDVVLGEFCDEPWGVPHVKFQISFDRKGRVEEITHTEIPPEHLEALLERVREVAKPHGKRLRGMLATVIVGFRSPSRN